MKNKPIAQLVLAAFHRRYGCRGSLTL